MSGRRIELSATQVTASVLAAVTGAVAASYLGVAGTIIGAAVVSFASTAGTVIYRHYLGRTQEKLREAAAQLPHPGVRPRSGHPAVPGSPVRVPAARGAGLATGYHLASTHLDLRPGNGSGPGAAGEPASTPVTARPRRVRWLGWTAATIGVFLLTMAGITVFEAATGRPLDAIVWHRHSSGTTLGNAVSGHPGSGSPTTRPASTPPQRSTAPATPSATPSPAPSASQTATPAPTPSPGGSSAPSPGSSGSTAQNPAPSASASSR